MKISSDPRPQPKPKPDKPPPPARAQAPGRPSNRWVYFGRLTAGAVGLVSLMWATAWHWPLPLCGFKHLTGLPCPFCGSTRCLTALSHGDVIAALHWNPLTLSACLALVAWNAGGLVKPSWPARLWEIGSRRAGAPTWGIALAGVAVNWLYLLLCLPR